MFAEIDILQWKLILWTYFKSQKVQKKKLFWDKIQRENTENIQNPQNSKVIFS